MDHETGVGPAGLPIQYSAHEVCSTFRDLLATFDFKAELFDLGIGSLDVFKRRNAKRHLTAVCIGLWHLALEKSFPNDAASFAEHLAKTFPPLAPEKKSTLKLRELVQSYDALLAEKKDGDFTVVADYMAGALGSVGDDRRRHQLKLSLGIRALYDTIFNNLIQIGQA